MKVKLCNIEDISEEHALKVDFFGREVLVFRMEGRPKAVLNYWPHLGGPMALQGDRLVCAWHAATFGATDGRCMNGPARPDSRLITLPTREEDGVLNYVYGE